MRTINPIYDFEHVYVLRSYDDVRKKAVFEKIQKIKPTAKAFVTSEWQWTEICTRFLNEVCQQHMAENGQGGKKLPVIFHTSYPLPAAVLHFGYRKMRFSIRKQEQN